ncbi:peptidyl-prolyl cis-trans isomerase [Erythrobacter sp. SD-21]|uniref:peptidyl-prolyl cis-trans isomerase n=1 Tax=Erythrobacter sp. SD-21 TaxID=161528 RepID=UPI000153F3CE|nr:peptidyl-prolyl cis-trans isomerase [Erythrobacter sp. SD-21]EDL48353.1 hypothetical protein ED21_22593 [Erythrobacter sp. SD-21]
MLALVGEPVDPSERSITLSREQQAGLALAFERTMGRAPTDAELDARIGQWVREEVLYREALRLGLDRGDPVVRRRLASKMDELASAEVETAAVSDDVLSRWLQDHPGRFAEGERFTFSHSYYPDEDALHSALDGDGREEGFPISLPPRMDGASYEEVKAVFGSKFAARIARMKPTRSAQLQSGFGWHLVDLEERTRGRARPLGDMRERVEADWRSSTAAARREKAFDLLHKAYTVDIE